MKHGTSILNVGYRLQQNMADLYELKRGSKPILYIKLTKLTYTISEPYLWVAWFILPAAFRDLFLAGHTLG